MKKKEEEALQTKVATRVIIDTIKYNFFAQNFH